MKCCSSRVLFILEQKWQKWSVRFRWRVIVFHGVPQVWPLVCYTPAHVIGTFSFLLCGAPGAVGNAEKRLRHHVFSYGAGKGLLVLETQQ